MDRSFRATALSLLLLSVSSLAPACAASDSNPGPDRSLQNARVTGTRPGSGRGGGNNNKVKILVQYDKTSPSKMQMVPAAIQARGLNMVKDIKRYGIMVVEVPESTAEKLVEEQFLRGLDGVLEVEDDAVMSVIPGLPEEGEMVKDGAGNYVVSKSGGDGRRAEEREWKQLRRRLTEETPWGITQVQADQVEAGAYKDDIMVCVVDTGYTPGHSDLPIDATGTDSTGNGAWNSDGHGHGSHCAGTVGAIGGNGVGVVGVIPDMTQNGFHLHIGKGLSDSGSGTTSGVIEAMNACQDAAEAGNKKLVVSMSLGGGGFSVTFNNAINTIYTSGNGLVIAAAGNGGNSAFSYPASYEGAMSVAATNSVDARASFSQYNSQVEISGPGVSVKSTIPPDNYATWSGTSMATPHVAAVAGLVWSHNTECTSDQIRAILSVTAKHMQGQNGCDVNYGYGLVQAKAAIDMLNIHGCDAGRPDALLPGDLKLFSGCQTILPPDGPTSAPTFPPTPTPCDIEPTVLTLTLTTDNYGAETSWDLLDDNEIVRHSVPSGTYGNAQTYSENLDVCACQDYTFRIKDTFGDGICCGYGSGSYVLKNSHGVTLASGGEFDSEQTTTFTANEDGLCGSEPVPTPAHYLACGSTHTTCSGQVITASPDEFHEVRCCSDTEKSGWMKKPQCNVWGESDLPTCYHGETYASAVQICADNGARLCTVKELQDECTRGSGCGHDSDFIWTSDIDADSANACRSSGEECNEGFDCCSNECLGMGTCV